MNLKDFKNWFIGFFDGEGYFNIHENTYKQKNGNIKKHYAFEIAIGIADRDKIVLERIQSIFGGHLNFRKIRVKNAQNQYAWRVSKREEIRKLIKFFETNPLQTPHKKIKFLEFKERFFSLAVKTERKNS